MDTMFPNLLSPTIAAISAIEVLRSVGLTSTD